jgi:cytochrome c
MRRHVLCLALAIGLLVPAGPEVFGQELRGHGGPVRALALTPDGAIAISGSFDTSAILWAIDRGISLAVLRHHDGPVNAVAAFPDGRFATGGADGRVAIWRPGSREPEQVIKAHQDAIAGFALAPGGRALATASWDGTARIITVDGGDTRVIASHREPLGAVAFMPDGKSVVTGSQDATLLVTSMAGGEGRRIAVGTPVNALVIAGDGEIAAGGADGQLRLISADGDTRLRVQASETPIIGLALSPDNATIAVAGVRGTVTLVDRATGTVKLRLVGPGLPVWSLAFRPDGRELLTGGGDRLVRRWDVRTGDHLGAVAMARPTDGLAAFGNDRGAQVFRACVACHTLDSDDGNRAGPTLAGIIGRRIATAPGYDFSPALKTMDIVWTRETIAKLFEIGPNAYTPGTKMPEQVVTDPDDRQALVDFIARVTTK